MEQKNYKEELKTRLCNIWNETRKSIATNIIRGHTRSISTDIEDFIALFISDVFENKIKLYVDPSISVNGTTYRPDILVVNNKNQVIALLEIKSNTGWCRDISQVVDNELVNRHNVFSDKGTLNCKFSVDKHTETVAYDKNVKLFLIILTSNNGGNAEQIKRNKEYAENNNVKCFILFDGWYDELHDREIDDFAEFLKKLEKN